MHTIYANLNDDNVVIQTIVIPDDQDERALDFITLDLGLEGTWLACDANSYRGLRRDGTPGIAFRKNYPEPGYTYDAETDSFWEPKPIQYPSWILDADGGFWKPPVPFPAIPAQSGMKYIWDEATISWIQVSKQPTQ